MKSTPAMPADADFREIRRIARKEWGLPRDRHLVTAYWRHVLDRFGINLSPLIFDHASALSNMSM